MSISKPSEILQTAKDVEDYALSALGYRKSTWRRRLRRLAPQPPTFKVALNAWYRERKRGRRRGMTPRQRTALSLRRSGLLIREIQSKLGITKDGVMRLLRKARMNEAEQVDRAVQRRFH